MTEPALREYLARIDYQGPLKADLSTLNQLQQQHLLSVPFENLDIHRGVRILLKPERIFAKIVQNRRGGFCYELNGLFYELLTQLGFRVKRVSAVVMDEPGQWSPEFDHMTLVVKLTEGDYLADVGFGRFSFRPLRLEEGLVQQNQEGTFRVEPGPAGRRMVSQLTEGKWKPQFAFSDKAHPLEAFNGMCAYQQDNPDSHFRKQRMITRPVSSGRITLTDKVLKITRGGAISEQEIRNEEDFQRQLQHHFGLDWSAL